MQRAAVSRSLSCLDHDSASFAIRRSTSDFPVASRDIRIGRKYRYSAAGIANQILHLPLLRWYDDDTATNNCISNGRH